MTPTRQHPRAGRWPATAVATLVAIAAVMPAGPVSASEAPDMVLDWNLNAVNALVSPPTASPPGAGQPPPVAAIHLAMVHGAVYDAVNLIDGGHRPYLDGLPSVSASASKAAAAATAAHGVLVGLQPALPLNVRDSLNELYAASLTQVAEGQAKLDGIDVGSTVAQAMLAERTDDGRYVPFPYTAGLLPGQWRPDLPTFASDPFAWVGNVRPFTLKSTGQFRTAGPFDLASAEYATDYNEVRAMGPATGSSRSEAQTHLARFYAANPMVMLNRTFRELAARRGMSITDAARLFGMSSMASADAGIGCTDDKHHWSFWRPITAIREAADDGNPDTAPQADWTPFFATPPYPDHPSGYNCFAAAMLHTAALVFGHRPIAFELLSPVTGTTRSYDRFTAVLKDTIDARIWQGLHFRNPDVQGAWLGKKVAQWVAKHYFQAID